MKLRHRNTAFACLACGVEVSACPDGIRNHCPVCLCSRHVDEQLPGDRTSGCLGVMDPVAVRVKHGDEQVLQRCRECRRAHWNVVATDDARVILHALPAG